MSSPSESLFLENEASDVNSRTDFPAITVKSTHFLQPADLLSLFIDCVMYAIHEASAEYLEMSKNEKQEHWSKVNVTHCFVANNT